MLVMSRSSLALKFYFCLKHFWVILTILQVNLRDGLLWREIVEGKVVKNGIVLKFDRWEKFHLCDRQGREDEWRLLGVVLE